MLLCVHTHTHTHRVHAKARAKASKKATLHHSHAAPDEEGVGGGGVWNDLSSTHDVDAQIEHAGNVSEDERRMGLTEWKNFLAAIGLVPAKTKMECSAL